MTRLVGSVLPNQQLFRRRTDAISNANVEDAIGRGFSERGNAPGLAGASPDFSGANRTEQLIGILQNVGRASSSVGVRFDREAAEFRGKKREIELAEHGRATRDAQRTMPLLLDAIRSGETLPEDGEDIEAFAERLIGDFYDDEDSDAYVQRARDIGIPPIIEAVVSTQRKRKQQAQSEFIDQIATGVAYSTNPADFDEAVISIRNIDPTMSENDAYRLVTRQAIERARVEGDRKGFDAAIDALGKRDPVFAAQQRKARQGELEKEIAKKRAAFADDIAKRAASLRTADEITDEAERLMLTLDDPTMTKDEALRSVALPAMARAAAEGDEAAFDAASKALDGADPLQELSHRNTLNRVIDARESQGYADANENLSTILVGVRDGYASFDEARSYVRRMSETLGSSWLDGRLAEIDRREASILAERNDALIEAFNESRRNDLIEAAVASGDNLYESIPEDVEYEIGGRVVRLKAGELREAAQARKFQQIAESTDDPAQALAEQIEYASTSGLHEWDDWKRKMDGVHAMIGTDGQVPEEAIRRFDAWLSMDAQNTAVAQSNVSSQTLRMFQVARGYMRYAGYDHTLALRSAARAFDPDAAPVESLGVGPTTFNAMIEKGFGDVQNADEMAARVRAFAMSIGGGATNAQTAIDLMKDDFVELNGFMNYHRSLAPSVIQSLPEISARLAESYVADSGADPDDFTIRSQNGQLWYLADRKSGLEIDDAPVFTPDDLAAANAERQIELRRDAANEARRQIDRMILRSTQRPPVLNPHKAPGVDETIGPRAISPAERSAFEQGSAEAKARREVIDQANKRAVAGYRQGL